MENEKLTWVTKPKGKRHYVVRWVDPKTELIRQRSTGLTRRRDAQSVADEVAAEIFTGRAEKNLGWRRFCERYKAEHLANLSPKTERKWNSAKNLIEKHIKPSCPRDLSANNISKMVGKLLKGGMERTTLQSHLAHVQSALSFAKKIGLIPDVPNISAPKKRGQKHMKGRPITGEELDRYLKAAIASPKIVPVEHGKSWQRIIEGLWLSGLRLGESLTLGWDDDWPIQVYRIDSRRPMLLIPGEEEKGGCDRIHPITPDFVAFLRKTNKRLRSGPVFVPVSFRGEMRSMQSVSDKLCDLGRAAKIVVDKQRKSGKVKYASAHDLRRSFGARWAAKVMPAVLQQLMRHADINTTMKFYVGQNAEQFADVVWNASVTNDRDPLRDPSQKRKARK